MIIKNFATDRNKEAVVLDRSSNLGINEVSDLDIYLSYALVTEIVYKSVVTLKLKIWLLKLETPDVTVDIAGHFTQKAKQILFLADELNNKHFLTRNLVVSIT